MSAEEQESMPPQALPSQRRGGDEGGDDVDGGLEGVANSGNPLEFMAELLEVDFLKSQLSNQHGR